MGVSDYADFTTRRLDGRGCGGCGGWLAVAPTDAAVCLCLGVTGQTENEARENFSRSFDRWKEILATDEAG